MKSSHDIQHLIDYYTTKLQTMREAVAGAAARERFALLCRINTLKRVLSMMEEVDYTIELLMEKARHRSGT